MRIVKLGAKRLDSVWHKGIKHTLMYHQGKRYYLRDPRWRDTVIPEENIRITSTVSATIRKVIYGSTYSQDNVQVAVISTAELLYALTDNRFLTVYNEAVLIDEVEDWGKVLFFKTKHRLYNLSHSDFCIEDSFDRVYYPNQIEYLGNNLYKLTFLNYNNVGTEGVLKFIVGATTTNAVGVPYEPFETVFYPLNLVPEFIPLPEVEAMWNE